MGEFVHLHLHSEFSLLDGVNRINDIPKNIKSKGMDAVAITDHGNMFGAVNFYDACIKEGVKPIIGAEVYLSRRDMHSKEYGIDTTRYHLILLVKNEIGYRNLTHLVTASNLEGMYYKPRIDKKILEEYSEGLICLSACMAGEISQLVLEDETKARQAAIWYKKVFGDDYYIEIQSNGLANQKLVNQKLIKLARELEIELVATNDCHYAERENVIDQEIVICIQTGKKLSDEDRMSIGTDELYIKSPEEMKEEFKNFPDAIANTVKIAEKCNFNFEFGHTILPNYNTPNGKDHAEYLKELCKEGLKKRYDNITDEIRKRAEYELSVIIQMGYVDYYLIVADYVNYAKSKNIPVGPGRGSGAGSLLAYAIGITEVDPLKYDLLFERFLNPERVSMPDFDIDFCNERREEVIRYVEKKYGKDHVSQIITFGTMAARMAIRDVGRVLDIRFDKVDKIAKLIPTGPNITIEYALETSKELLDEYENDEDVKTLIDHAKRLEGMPRNLSTHACGVVITKEPVETYVPLASNDNSVITQYTMDILERLGLLKMDFLGLRTLSVIDECEKMVKKTRGITVKYDDNYDDPNVFELWKNADTLGVFQFESEGMIRFMKELAPDSLEDIIAGVSLYRPGPMDQIPRYIEGKKNRKSIKYLHEKLEPILDVTYGCMVYQEQVMQITRELAGYSYARADIVRRAMGKKKIDVMEKEREIFINGLVEDGKVIVPGCVRNGVSEDIANEIFDEMYEFAKYAFNKSHAAAYSILSYKTAYLKTYYKEELYAATMNSYLGNLTKISTYIIDAKRHGITILPPNINESFVKFTAIPKEHVIRFGVGSIKTVGEVASKIIIEERKQNGNYLDFRDFVERTNKIGVNKKAIESLIKVGAFDCFKENRGTLLKSYEDIIDSVNNTDNGFRGQTSMFDMIEDTTDVTYTIVEDISNNEKLKYEKELLGIYVSGHPLEKVYKYIEKKINFNSDMLEKMKSGKLHLKNNTTMLTAGMISNVTRKTTKKGNLMVFVILEDIYGEMELILFENQYMRFKELLKEDNIVAVKLRIGIKNETDVTLYVDNMTNINFKKKNN